MLETTKIKTPETIEDYEKIRLEASKKNWSYTNEAFGYIWFERTISTTPKKKPPIEETMFYNENLELWKQWSPKLREAYKQFRQERFAQHKDFVSYAAEKLLMNKINKYNESISIKLMKASSGYKSIVEHHDIISEGRTELQIQENLNQEERIEQEKQEALKKRKKQEEAITNSGKPYKYWENMALEQLKQQYPDTGEDKLQRQINPRIRTILKAEGFM